MKRKFQQEQTDDMLCYLLFVALAIVFTVLVAFYWKKRGLISLRHAPQPEENAQAPRPISGLLCALLLLSVAAFIFIAAFLLYRGTNNLVDFAKLLFLCPLLACAALTDLCLRIVPNLLIAIGLSIRLICYVLEFVFYRGQFKALLISDLIGFGIGFGLLLIVSLITKHGLGFGDVKLFGVIGLMASGWGTFSILFASLVLSALTSIALLAAKRKDRKGTIPFVPFVFAGYLITVLLASY